MKHYRLNQIAMAVLGALLLIFGTKTLINIAFEEHKPEKPETEVAGAKHEEKPGEQQAAAGASELPAVLAKGDAKRGETTAAVCKACHSFGAGVPSPIGPNLHNVVGRKIASVEGFNYSPALKSKEGNWTYENLDHWLTNPQVFAQGTTMGFPGLPDAQQRGDAILFLRSQTDNPPPLPAVVAAAPAAKVAKPTEGAKPGGEAAPGAEILPALAKADPKKGEGDVTLCKVCHSFDKGTPSPVGPNLYGVVGRKIASLEGFSYSPALKGKTSEGDWTFEHLDMWLTNPQAFASGTTMAFPGLPDLATRADVIAFLRAKSDNPVPLPQVAAPAAAPAAAAAPKAEEPAPAAAPEAAPAGAPQAPKVEEAAPAPAAETPAAPTPAETPSEPSSAAETPATAPSAEMPAKKPAPSTEPSEPGPASDADTSGPSTANQPQPTYPEGELQ
jgi:cytochrome c